MESPEEDEQPEAPAARLGGWRLRLSESCADIPVRLLAPSPHKKKTTAVAIVLRSG